MHHSYTQSKNMGGCGCKHFPCSDCSLFDEFVPTRSGECVTIYFSWCLMEVNLKSESKGNNNAVMQTCFSRVQQCWIKLALCCNNTHTSIATRCQCSWDVAVVASVEQPSREKLVFGPNTLEKRHSCQTSLPFHWRSCFLGLISLWIRAASPCFLVPPLCCSVDGRRWAAWKSFTRRSAHCCCWPPEPASFFLFLFLMPESILLKKKNCVCKTCFPQHFVSIRKRASDHQRRDVKYVRLTKTKFDFYRGTLGDEVRHVQRVLCWLCSQMYIFLISGG